MFGDKDLEKDGGGKGDKCYASGPIGLRVGKCRDVKF